MKWSTFLAIVLLGWVCATVGADSVDSDVPAGNLWQGECVVSFECTSTLHDFHGQVKSRPFTMMITADPNTGEDVLTTTVEVAVRDITTHKKDRDKSMRKMFKVKSYPLLSGIARNVPLAKIKPRKKTVKKGDGVELLDIPGQLPFELTIKDHAQPVAAAVKHWTQTDDAIHFEMVFELSLKQCKLKPPSVLGLIKVGDTVKLTVTATLDKAKKGEKEPGYLQPMPPDSGVLK